MNIWRAMWGLDGRISRKTFWLAALVWTVGFLAIMLPLAHWFCGGEWMNAAASEQQIAKAFSSATLVASVVLLYPSLAMSVKRLHDLRFSAWWCVPAFIPGFVDTALPLLSARAADGLFGQAVTWITLAVGLVYLVVLGFIRGTDGPNEYGDDPRVKAPAMMAVPA